SSSEVVVSVYTCYLWCSFDVCAAHQDLHSFPTRRSSDLWRLPDFCLEPERGQPCAGDGVRSGRHPHAAVPWARWQRGTWWRPGRDRKSTRLNSSHVKISYAVFCLKKKKK